MIRPFLVFDAMRLPGGKRSAVDFVEMPSFAVSAFANSRVVDVRARREPHIVVVGGASSWRGATRLRRNCIELFSVERCIPSRRRTSRLSDRVGVVVILCAFPDAKASGSHRTLTRFRKFPAK